MEFDELRRRRRANVVGAVVVALIIGAGIWLVNRLDAAKRSQECLGSGSVRCRVIDGR